MKKAQRHVSCLGIEDLAGRHIRATAEANLVGEDIGGSGWKDAENHGIRRARVSSNAVDRFVDRAVATSCQDALTPSIRRLRGHVSGRIRTGGSEQLDPVPGALEDLSRTIEPRPFRPFQPAGKRVENNANSLE